MDNDLQIDIEHDSLPSITSWDSSSLDGKPLLVIGFPVAHIAAFDDSFNCISINEIDASTIEGVSEEGGNFIPILGCFRYDLALDKWTLDKVSQEMRVQCREWMLQYCVLENGSVSLKHQYISYDDSMLEDMLAPQDEETKTDIAAIWEMGTEEMVPVEESAIPTIKKKEECADDEEKPTSKDFVSLEEFLDEGIEDEEEEDELAEIGVDDELEYLEADNYEEEKSDLNIVEESVVEEIKEEYEGSISVEYGGNEEENENLDDGIEFASEPESLNSGEEDEEKRKQDEIVERLYKLLSEENLFVVSTDSNSKQEIEPPAEDFLTKGVQIIKSSDWQPIDTVGKPHLIIPGEPTDRNMLISAPNAAIRSQMGTAEVIVAFENDEGEPHKIWLSQGVVHDGLLEFINRATTPLMGIIKLKPISEQAGEASWDLEPAPQAWSRAIMDWVAKYCEIDETSPLNPKYSLRTKGGL